MVDFEAGVVDRMLMWNITAMLYDIGGFWLTVTLPFVFSGALTAVGIALQVRDIRRLVRGQTGPNTDHNLRIGPMERPARRDVGGAGFRGGDIRFCVLRAREVAAVIDAFEASRIICANCRSYGLKALEARGLDS